MAINIKSAIISNKGIVRAYNEDNFVFDRRILTDINEEISIAKTAKCDKCIIAVFDGMGGESSGEIASKIAATTFQKIKNTTLEGVKNAIFSANMEICQYMKINKIKRMGTTVAAVYIDKTSISVVNVGDSKIYKYEKGTLEQVSYDHITTRHNNRRELTQHLGIFPNEMQIEPYIFTDKIKDRIRYLICSDGLTDMVSEEDIAVSMSNSIEEIPIILKDKAIENGGRDNITIVVFEIKKEAKKIFEKMFN